MRTFYDFEQLLLCYLFNHIYAICFSPEIQQKRALQNPTKQQQQHHQTTTTTTMNDNVIFIYLTTVCCFYVFPASLPRVFLRCLNPFRCDFMRKFRTEKITLLQPFLMPLFCRRRPCSQYSEPLFFSLTQSSTFILSIYLSFGIVRTRNGERI